MSSMKSITSKFDSVDSIVNYLLEPSVAEVVSSTTPSTMMRSKTINNQLKSTKKPKKEKESANFMIIANPLQLNPKENSARTPTGRVRYGPITVNPRKQPSKTLFTGRRSKYEELEGDEEEKRRLRRDRNRVAATKCREKRDNVLNVLENEYRNELNNYNNLLNFVQELNQRKQYLESLLPQEFVNHPLQINPTPPPQQTSMVFGNTGFLSSIMETPAPPLPPHQSQIIKIDEEEFSRFLQPTPVLTNSAYNMDDSHQLFLPEQQTITMNSSSIERLLNSLQSPVALIDNNSNNCSGLFNSAYGSSCARQHSSSSEDDSLPPARSNNHYVC